jgi:hypothetical protein
MTKGKRKNKSYNSVGTVPKFHSRTVEIEE